MIGYPIDSHVTFNPQGVPTYDRAISSEPLRKLIKSLFSDGVLPNPSTNMQVQSGEGMTVIVNPGFAICNGCMKLEEKARTLVVQASSTSLDRIDTVILRLNNNEDVRSLDFYVLQGTPATNPVRPSLTQNDTIWEIGLADVFIASNTSVITNQRITDTRYETARCGIISSISEFDTTTLYNQVKADLDEFKDVSEADFTAWITLTKADFDNWMDTEKSDFDAWFKTIQSQLSGNVAANLQAQIGYLPSLETQDKTDLVRAINELTKKLSKVDTTDNLSVELAKKIDKPVSATDGQVLTYNGTSNEWEAKDSKGGAGKQVKSCEYAIERWLRFDPSNRKGLIIKAGTSIRNSQGSYIDFDSDTSVDLTSVITTAGEDYYVYMLDDGSITASLTSATAPSNSVRIGRFHSLCVAVGTCTMIVPPSGIAVGSNYLVKSYRQDEDLDFFNLYNKSVTATGTNNETLAHPLSGFEAGAILPESVMCLSFHSGSLFDDGQVYDKDIDAFIDIYLQSGIGLNTRSKYGATHTVSRTQCNHMVDMRQVGKKLLSDGEFESASIGSNQATSIQGSADKGTVGGHVDTANRRMISAIGVEEMCGYLWQWTRDVSSTGGSSWATTDNNGSFGLEYGTPFVLLAGGAWGDGSYCGSRYRASDFVRSRVFAAIGGRGLSRVVRGV